MPRKASPLSSSSIGNFTWSYIFIHHMICVLLGASCMIWVFAFQFTTIILAVHTFWRDTHESEFIRILYVLHLYLLSQIILLQCFTYTFLRAWWWFYFIEIIDLSCFTYIILRVFQNSMVVCFGYKISPNMMNIQDGYNKNYHIKCTECYEKFDSL